MNSKHTSFLKKNSHLLIAAAWLLTFAFIVNNYWSVTSTPQAIQKKIQADIHEKEKAIQDLFNDSSLLEKLADNHYSESELRKLVEKNFFIFIYSDPDTGNFKPVFWNTQATEPDSLSIGKSQTTSVDSLANGWFVTKRKVFQNLKGDHFRILGLIPVKWNYYIQNKYLQNDFVAVTNISNAYDISPIPGSLSIKSAEGKDLFYLKQISPHRSTHVNFIALSLGVLGLILLLFFVHTLSNYIVRLHGFLKGLLVLTGSLFAIRMLTYGIDPYQFRQLDIFSPSVYGASIFLRSLGDLLINSILFVWIVLFIRYHFRYNFYRNSFKSGLVRYSSALGIATLMVAITFISGTIIASLVADKQISFDVLNFFSLKIYSFIGFIVISCVAVAYYFLIQLLMQPLKAWLKNEKPLPYLFIAVIGLLVLTLQNRDDVTYRILLLLWLLLFVYLLDFKVLLLHVYRMVSSRYIFWIFFFSVSITSVIVIQNRSKELEARKHFAENLAKKADPFGPVIMNIILTDFKNQYLSDIFYLFRNKNQNARLKDSLVNEKFSGYLNKYDTEIYTFDSSGKPLYNAKPTSFNDLNTIIRSQGKPTGIPDLYYYDVSYEKFNYISRKDITDSSGQEEGTVFIVSKPKKFKSEALYPELFSRGNTNSIESSSEYSFAIYNNYKLSSSYNDYPFSTRIDSTTPTYHDFNTVYKNGYEELWYRPRSDKVIVIARQDRFIMESVTLFAYLFCSFLLITLFFNLIGHFLSDNKQRPGFRPFWQMTIRNQVHGTIILISIFSFVVIGISTILFFINRYHSNNREKLSRTIHVMENELRSTLDSSTLHQIKTRNLENVSEEKISQIINNVSNIHATDINLYDLNGNLRVSSVPLPYEKGIISEKMSPVAWYHLNNQKDAQFFQEQEIGNLHYLSNYLPVRDENGDEYGYLNIPYFESQTHLQDEISNFLVAIINLNAFIFLIAGIIALFITNKITRSFLLISNKMKQLSLQSGNEEIVWNRKDEIGDLVKEYNKMVRQLEKSAEKLARSEREGAWREMARQVAHEIKNPLTPMKLNLQYLQMTLDKDSKDAKNISLYVAKIMLEQIEHLSKIAGDFAQFANISNANAKDVDLNELLKNTITLYSTNEEISIRQNLYQDGLLIHADKTQINRLFTNLLQNAVQSVPDTRKVQIEITSTIREGRALVSVKDNGNGIPEDMKSKIFIPNFTTKSSGTGLGLAMCKGIVEKINGEIWFDTCEGSWTVFYISIPLLPSKENKLSTPLSQK